MVASPRRSARAVVEREHVLFEARATVGTRHTLTLVDVVVAVDTSKTCHATACVTCRIRRDACSVVETWAAGALIDVHIAPHTNLSDTLCLIARDEIVIGTQAIRVPRAA